MRQNRVYVYCCIFKGGVTKMIQKNVGKKIKQLRESHKMTLEQLGDRLGVTKGYIHHMENGNRKISLDFLQSIADIFNVEMYYFFTDKQVVELDNETVTLINAKKEWDKQEITIDDINEWIEIANKRRRKA